jgi:hypothetical protein
VKILLDNFDAIRAEALQVARSKSVQSLLSLSLLRYELAQNSWKPWPEQHYSDGGSQDWTVFPFCHTFPANQPENRKFIETTCEVRVSSPSRARTHTLSLKVCPVTAAVLQSMPNVRTALFSRLGPEVLLEVQRYRLSTLLSFRRLVSLPIAAGLTSPTTCCAATSGSSFRRETYAVPSSRSRWCVCR